jgi:hypothetical protein
LIEAYVNYAGNNEKNKAISLIRIYHYYKPRMREERAPSRGEPSPQSGSVGFTRNELLTSLLARCELFANTALGAVGSHTRQFLMDKRGEGVPIILSNSKKLSGRFPEYKLIDDTELMLTIFAAGNVSPD